MHYTIVLYWFIILFQIHALLWTPLYESLLLETPHLEENYWKMFYKSLFSVSRSGVKHKNGNKKRDSSHEEKKVDYCSDKDDIQRPDKLDLVIGFLRLFNFLSVSTSVYIVIVSILFSIQQKQTLILNIWQIKTLQDVNDTFSVLKHMEQNKPFILNETFCSTLESQQVQYSLPTSLSTLCLLSLIASQLWLLDGKSMVS